MALWLLTGVWEFIAISKLSTPVRINLQIDTRKKTEGRGLTIAVIKNNEFFFYGNGREEEKGIVKIKRIKYLLSKNRNICKE